MALKKLAFKMKLKPGAAVEYQKRHDEIWPELSSLLKDSGSQDLGMNPLIQRWWAYMADLMEINEDNSPVSIPLREVFHMK